MNILPILNAHRIVFNTTNTVEAVTEYNHTLTFHMCDGIGINIHTGTFIHADYDIDHDNDVLYVVNDTDGITHTFKMYGNVTNNVMLQLQGVNHA